jgi:diguanylate cyclase (GGDEF)-like protein
MIASPGALTPAAAGLGRGPRRLLAAASALLGMLLLVLAANAAPGVVGASASSTIRDWISSAAYLIVAVMVVLRALTARGDRLAHGLFAAGVSLYALGNILWAVWVGRLPRPPIPSICDGLWLSLYPLSYAAILGFARIERQRILRAGVWLDGLIGGAALAALGSGLVLPPVLAGASGEPGIAVATELAYPICDLLLVALVFGVLTLRERRIDLGWKLFGGGFVLLAAADCLYAVQVAGGATAPAGLTNLLYVLAVSMLALAVWQPEVDDGESRQTSWWLWLAPAGFTVAVLGLLSYDHFHRLSGPAFAMVIVTLLAGVVRTALAFRDLRELADVRRQAATDDLTSLPNRREFMRRADHAIAAAAPAGHGVAVLMVDLDNFKQLNDTLGHVAGDALLRMIGPRLTGALRGADTLARLGGDEFAILLDPAHHGRVAIDVAGRVLARLREPFDVDGVSLRMTGSIGISQFPDDAGDVDELLRHADIAMYEAKASRAGFARYAVELDTHSPARLVLAAELAAALEGDVLEVHYQPQANAGSRRIEGLEALVRWRRSDGTLVPPSDFVPAAEQAGLARALTRTVLAAALDQLRAWRDAGRDLHVAVNTMASDVLDEAFPDEVADALAARGLPPESLVLELTETSLLRDPARVAEVLGRLRRYGVGLSLDDFGTGYSSLTRLKSLPVTEVKVDRSFVARMCEDSVDAAIVFGTIELAQQLGIRAVAEGVEDQRTWDLLRESGCHLIQGFALSRPLPAAELEGTLRGATAMLAPQQRRQARPSGAGGSPDAEASVAC